MQAFTYNQLLSAMQVWPVNANPTYVTSIPTLIGLGELRVVRDLNLELFDDTINIAITAGDRNVPRPTTIVSDRAMWLYTGNVRSELPKRSRAFCTNYAPDPTARATPKYYCDISDTNWNIVPTPVQSSNVDVLVVQRPDGLALTNQTSWIGNNCGDLVFIASLMEAEHFLKADDRYEDLKKKYHEELLPIARIELRNSIRKGDYTPTQKAS